MHSVCVSITLLVCRTSESTTEPVTPSMFHWDALAADLVAVAAAQLGDALLDTPLVVVGDSMGAATALTATALEPGFRETVRGLVLMRPPNIWEAREKWKKVMAAAARRREGRLQAVFLGSSETNLPPREIIAQVDVPVLLLGVRGDKVHPVESIEKLAEVLPHSTSVVVNSWEEAQTEFPAAIAAFYRESIGNAVSTR